MRARLRPYNILRVLLFFLTCNINNFLAWPAYAESNTVQESYFPSNKTATLDDCWASTDENGNVSLGGIGGAGPGHILMIPAHEKCHLQNENNCQKTFAICFVDPSGLSKTTTDPDGTLGGWSEFAQWQDATRSKKKVPFEGSNSLQ